MKYLAGLFAQPGQAIALAFASAIGLGTAVLSLPMATTSGQRAPLIDALFTATSAVCVTGLVTVDTGSYWSPFGQVVIALLIQAGGLGIMTLATIIAVVFFRRVGLSARMAAMVETKSMSASDVRSIVGRVVLFSLGVELVLAAVLTLRFATEYAMAPGRAVAWGLFHSISAFNNAGFGLAPDNLVPFFPDAWVLLPICAAIIVGGLGFPVVFELRSHWRRPTLWSALTRITLILTAGLLAITTLALLVIERRNAATWGGLDPGAQLLGSFVTGVMPRTAGFNVVDVGAMESESLAVTTGAMFIGGGSAGTAGGIKVTTLGILLLVVWAELRGRVDVEIGWRRVASQSQRQALAVAVVGVVIVTVGIAALSALTAFDLESVVFEVVSAFATVGLSVGITASLPTGAKLVVIALMFVGRIGPLTVASALAARRGTRLHRRPEERISIG